MKNKKILIYSVSAFVLGILITSVYFIKMNKDEAVNRDASGPISIIEPNIKSNLSMGKKVNIRWKDDLTANVLKDVDYTIKLNEFIDCGEGNLCVQGFSVYTINPIINGYDNNWSYSWYVGDVWEKGIGPKPGSYELQICRLDTQICDYSRIEIK